MDARFQFQTISLFILCHILPLFSFSGRKSIREGRRANLPNNMKLTRKERYETIHTEYQEVP